MGRVGWCKVVPITPLAGILKPLLCGYDKLYGRDTSAKNMHTCACIKTGASFNYKPNHTHELPNFM